MYIFAVALEDGKWHHVKSYTPERARRKSTIDLWHKIKTFEDKNWTEKYHNPNPANKCFGGRVTIFMEDGSKIVEERGVADAHPSGQRPFRRNNYIEKFKMLTDGIISNKEAKRFLQLVQNLKNLKAKDINQLNVEVMSKNHKKRPKKITIF
jgi:2-methylcitrate dehydratase